MVESHRCRRSTRLVLIVVVVACVICALTDIWQSSSQHNSSSSGGGGVPSPKTAKDAADVQPFLAASSHLRTTGGCYDERYPYVRHGGIRYHNDSHLVVLALPGTNTAQLFQNLSSCSGAPTIQVVLEVQTVAPPFTMLGVNDVTSESLCRSHRLAEPTDATSHQETIIGVAWLWYVGVPFHDLYYPNGYIGQRALLEGFALNVTTQAAPNRTIPVRYVLKIYSPSTFFPSLVAQFHYRSLFDNDRLRAVPPATKNFRGDYWHCSGYLVVIPELTLRAQFWSLPLLNLTVKLARRKLLEAQHQHVSALPVLSRHVFVEKRTYTHVERRQQHRGYRPAVWAAVTNMARRNGLTLDVISMRRLTFRQQLRELHRRPYVIASEGSFSVWVPFLRAGTILLSIYDYYGEGWHVPRVHLPVALLGDRVAKVVFVAIYNHSVPTEEVFTNELFKDTAAQVKVVTFPHDERRLAYLSTADGETLVGGPKSTLPAAFSTNTSA